MKGRMIIITMLAAMVLIGTAAFAVVAQSNMPPLPPADAWNSSNTSNVTPDDLGLPVSTYVPPDTPAPTLEATVPAVSDMPTPTPTPATADNGTLIAWILAMIAAIAIAAGTIYYILFRKK